jgi:hypothetical protein
MPDNLILPFLITAAGAVLLFIGYSRREQALSFKAIPCRPIGSLAGGEKQFISGKTHSPFPVTAPVSKTPCVFYRERVERSQHRSSSRGGGSNHWVTVSDTAYGAFFVTDPTGTALVFPGSCPLDLVRPETSESDDLLLGAMEGATRRTERIIDAEALVTVLGTPRHLGEFIQYLRQNAGGISPDLVAELLKLENAAGPALPCFFGGGVQTVADQPYDEFTAGGESSASSLLWAGAAVTALGACAILYTLNVFKGGMPE